MEQLIKSSLIKWARERQNFSVDNAAKKLGIKTKTLNAWEQGGTFPTFKQIEKIAQKFYVPLGYLFLSEPPIEKLPIPDFRTTNNEEVLTPSPNLLDVVHDAQLKQSWLKEIREEEGGDPIVTSNNQETASLINKKLNIFQLREEAKNYEDFLNSIITQLDKQGFIIIRNSIVGNNIHRPLDVGEFRGFALYDECAPLIFINGKDAKAGQIFTVIHELAHLYLGESALDGGFDKNTEQTCNQIAAEVLVPEKEFKDNYKEHQEEKIAKEFKVSRFVILLKAKHLNLVTQEYFNARWQELNKNVQQDNRSRSTGGDFYKNIKFRAGGERFLNTVIHYTLAGKVLYRDAYRLTGLKGKTFNEYCKKIEAIS